jgi:hypothetical protein
MHEVERRGSVPDDVSRRIVCLCRLRLLNRKSHVAIAIVWWCWGMSRAGDVKAGSIWCVGPPLVPAATINIWCHTFYTPVHRIVLPRVPVPVASNNRYPPAAAACSSYNLRPRTTPPTIATLRPLTAIPRAHPKSQNRLPEHNAYPGYSAW